MTTLRILPGELNLVFFKRDAANIKLSFSESIDGLTWVGAFLDRDGAEIFIPTITPSGTTILYVAITQEQMALLAAKDGATWYIQETTTDRSYFAGTAKVLERL
jgi:hypothetical protein